jgi:aspartyl protease family protein
MIGWALRWVLLSCAAAIVWVAVADRGGLLEPTSGATPEVLASRATQAESPPAAADNTLIYPADARGHVILDAVVNGAPVRFLVDTGASFVTLTPADARAVGLNPRQLAFNELASTANGEVRIATVSLREIRLDQLSVKDVPAAVIENLKVSLLGMSFLTRLRGYEMRNGKLTMSW